MSKYQIDNNIPIPPRLRFPFDLMNVGDSIFIPHTDLKDNRGLGSYWKKLEPMKFISRTQTEDVYDDGQHKFVPTPGTRVWRTV